MQIKLILTKYHMEIFPTENIKLYSYGFYKLILILFKKKVKSSTHKILISMKPLSKLCPTAPPPI